MTLSEVGAALAEAQPELRLTRRDGLNSSTIIDDSYNASPASMLAALDLLGELPGRRIALLGAMRELGSATDEGNRQVGARAAERCDLLMVVGEDAREIGHAAEKSGLSEVRYAASPDEAAGMLRKELSEGDFLLVKGSRAVGLESAVRALVVR
jgi:UDP-N-acetylmuramoyl-tripeptide--D-alanyl-D-alanine ligase